MRKSVTSTEYTHHLRSVEQEACIVYIYSSLKKGDQEKSYILS